MKRSQFQITPLLYVFALIVGALILVFGIQQIYKLTIIGEEVELGTFVLNLEKQVNSMYNLDFGSSAEISLSIPSKITFICFTNGRPGTQTSNQRLEELLYLDSTNNVFILAEEATEDQAFKIEHLESDESPLCIRSKSKIFKIILENRGNYVTPIESTP